MRFSPITLEQALWLADRPHLIAAFIAKMTPSDLLRLDAAYEIWRHKGQIPPGGEGWRTWLMTAGRGFGKTRAGAEWITALAAERRPIRIALVGATEADARDVMIEGESGLLAVGGIYGIEPKWEPSLGRLSWPGGAQAQVFSGENPEKLRGPQHHFAWCDELAKWVYPDAAWDNLQMTLRLGERPRALVTTTPKSIALLKRIEGERWTVKTKGRTTDNPHLPDAFVEAMVETYGGTRQGRQELDGEYVEEVEGALWGREVLEAARILPEPGRWQPEGLTEGGLCQVQNPLHHAPHAPPRAGEDFARVVIGVDPPGSVGGTCGIVAVGLGEDGKGYVLGDHSAAGLSPEGWAGKVAYAYALHEADRVIAEKNMGGDMVESVLRGADAALPVKLVSASRGKSARAEPVAALYEKGKVKHLGLFQELEDELAGMQAGGGFEPRRWSGRGSAGKSPDRADALVWALTELMLGKARPAPRVHFF